MCMWDGGDGPEIASHRIVRARKEHKCAECGRIIAIGEEYRYDFQVYEGDAYSWHTCRHCRVAQQWLIRECGGYLIEGTWEDIAEHVREYPALRFPLGRLMVGCRSKWARRGELLPVPAVPTASVAEYVLEVA